MNRPLQQFGFKESPYERPMQKWVCGHAAEGNPCHVGPDGRGRCSAHLESHCTPRRGNLERGEVESRWYCTRPEPYGGTCECGPKPDGSCCHPEPEHLPCQPRLSLRARRGRVTLAVALCTIGMLTLLIAGPWGMSFISPGAVTSAHESAIGSGAGGANSCAACHQPHPEHGSFLQPVADTACLQCHAAEAHFPARSTAEVGALMQIAGHLDPIHMAAGCADCHTEHKGPDHNLSRLPDSTCTSCHASLGPWRKDPESATGVALHITRFAANHPEFRAVRDGAFDDAAIRFEHHVHMDPTAKGMQERLDDWAHLLREHGVSDQQIPIDRLDDGRLRLGCAACHESDTAGRFMLPIQFAKHCDHCHDLGTKADERVPHGPAIGNYVTRIAAKLVMSPPEPPAPPPSRGGPPGARPAGPPGGPPSGPPSARPTGPPARPSGPPSGPPCAPPASAARPSGPPSGPPSGGPPRGGPPPAGAQLSSAGPPGLSFASSAERSQWFNQRLTEETTKLNRGLSASCGKCHGPKADPADMVAPGIRERWYPESRFSHAAHGFMQCTACHTGAAFTSAPPPASNLQSAPAELRWTGRTKEIMIPGVQACRVCHGDIAPAESNELAAVGSSPLALALHAPRTPARHDCITCHRFHVPDLTGDPRVVPATPLKRQAKK